MHDLRNGGGDRLAVRCVITVCVITYTAMRRELSYA